jgi:hypothetical protein
MPQIAPGEKWQNGGGQKNYSHALLSPANPMQSRCGLAATEAAAKDGFPFPALAGDSGPGNARWAR